MTRLYSTGIARMPSVQASVNDLHVFVGQNRYDFHLHKATMARGSTYFHALFSGGHGQSQTSVFLGNINANVFKMCIDYIYTGVYIANNTDEHAQLFSAAVYLGITGLKAAAMCSFCTAVLADVQTRAPHRVQRATQAIKTLYAGSNFAERHQQIASQPQHHGFANSQQSVFFNFLDNMMQSKFLGFGEDGGVIIANTITEETPDLMLDLLWVRRIESYMRKVLEPQHMCKQCYSCTDSILVYLPCRKNDNKDNNNNRAHNNREAEQVGLYIECEPCGGRRGATWVCKECKMPKEAVSAREEPQNMRVIR